MMTENYHLNQLQRLSDGASDHCFDVQPQPAAIFTEKPVKNVQYLNMKHSCKRNRYFPQELVEKHNRLKKMNTRLPFIQRTTNRQVITDNTTENMCFWCLQVAQNPGAAGLKDYNLCYVIVNIIIMSLHSL